MKPSARHREITYFLPVVTRQSCEWADWETQSHFTGPKSRLQEAAGLTEGHSKAAEVGFTLTVVLHLHNFHSLSHEYKPHLEPNPLPLVLYHSLGHGYHCHPFHRWVNCAVAGTHPLGMPGHTISIYFQLSKSDKVKSLSHVRLFATPRTIAYQPPPSMGFSRQECWSGLPFPPPGDLSDPGIEPPCPALAGGFSTSEPPGNP